MNAIEIILKETGFKSIPDLKRYLLKIKKNEYGCFCSEIKKPSFRVFYTSNPNHFCEFGVSMRKVGMSDTQALDKESLTKEGKIRCPNHYLKP